VLWDQHFRTAYQSKMFDKRDTVKSKAEHLDNVTLDEVASSFVYDAELEKRYGDLPVSSR